MNEVTVDSEIPNNRGSMAGTFNDYFTSGFTANDWLGLVFEPVAEYTQNRSPLPDITISEEGILNILFNINVKKAQGPDSIYDKFFKRYATWCGKYYVSVFLCSARTAIFPAGWQV